MGWVNIKKINFISEKNLFLLDKLKKQIKLASFPGGIRY